MNFNYRTLESAPISSGTKVLLRLDLNLQITDGKITDDFRITKSLPTLEYLRARGARTVILAHTDSKETDSLKLVSDYLEKFVSLEFVETVEELPERLTALRPGEFIFLENLRRNPGEVANDPEFAKFLASHGDIYINDAFAVSHRNHASIVGIPKFLPSYAGLLFAEEVARLSKAFNPPKPFVFILAGAKFETKLPLVEKFLKLADFVFVGGALANDLFKAKGYEIGLSKHSDVGLDFSRILLDPKLILPVDVVVGNDGVRLVKKPTEVTVGDNIFDSGPQTTATLSEKFSTAEFILWNGTLGVCESGFKEGTEALAEALAKSKIEVIVGGGDTVASISSQGLLDKFSFVSTGGGAMLDFLANDTLPGITALESCSVSQNKV